MSSEVDRVVVRVDGLQQVYAKLPSKDSPSTQEQSANKHKTLWIPFCALKAGEQLVLPDGVSVTISTIQWVVTSAGFSDTYIAIVSVT